MADCRATSRDLSPQSHHRPFLFGGKMVKRNKKAKKQKNKKTRKQESKEARKWRREVNIVWIK